MSDPIIVIAPVIKSVILSSNPVDAGDKMTVSVTVMEEIKTLYMEERYAGEFYVGE